MVIVRSQGRFDQTPSEIVDYEPATLLFGQRGVSSSRFRGWTGALVASACGEVTHPAQGAASGCQAGRTLVEALLRDCADQALAQLGESGAFDRRELPEGAGNRALAGDPDALRDSRAGSRQDGRARPCVVARPPRDIAGVDQAIDKANGPRVGQANDPTEGLLGPPWREVE